MKVRTNSVLYKYLTLHFILTDVHRQLIEWKYHYDATDSKDFNRLFKIRKFISPNNRTTRIHHKDISKLIPKYHLENPALMA